MRQNSGRTKDPAVRCRLQIIASCCQKERWWCALHKIDRTKMRFEGASRTIQHLFIANPLRKFGAQSGPLFSTHPPTPDRIARLRELR